MKVIGSFWKKKAKNIVKIGPRVLMMAVSIEVVIVIAIRKLSSMVRVSLSMTTTPMFSKELPVDWMGSPFSPEVITVWE